MILLDTHVWVWWVSDESKLSESHREIIQLNEAAGIGISSISCWEVALLVQKRKLWFTLRVRDWLRGALNYPGVVAFDVTPDIAVDSVHLPGTFHKDPADRIIVATARANNCPLLTYDRNILNYPHVKIAA